MVPPAIFDHRTCRTSRSEYCELSRLQHYLYDPQSVLLSDPYPRFIDRARLPFPSHGLRQPS